MNIRRTANFLAYCCAAACAAAVVLGITALSNGDYGDAVADGFLFVVAGVCLWVNLGTGSGPSTPEF
jgi:hypothetical protein